MRGFSIHLIGVPKEQVRENEAEKIKEIMARKFLEAQQRFQTLQ